MSLIKPHNSGLMSGRATKITSTRKTAAKNCNFAAKTGFQAGGLMGRMRPTSDRFINVTVYSRYGGDHECPLVRQNCIEGCFGQPRGLAIYVVKRRKLIGAERAGATGWWVSRRTRGSSRGVNPKSRLRMLLPPRKEPTARHHENDGVALGQLLLRTGVCEKRY
jgi:hypothetical protein